MMRAILERQKIIPVLTLDNLEDGYFITKLLGDNGFKTIEITLRTDNALEIARRLKAEFKTYQIGVGTVTTINKLVDVMEHNFAFAVSPGLNVAMANMADMAALPYLPAVSTFSEAMTALSINLKTLKFFPAEVMGGVNYLKQFAAVMPELRFCPTGGIMRQNIRDYLALPNVLCVGCSDIAPKQLIKSKDETALLEHINGYASI